MKKVTLFAGALLIVSLVSACAALDNAADRSDRYDGGSHSGHHH